MKDYRRWIRTKFKLLALWYDAFDLVFVLDDQGNPRRALASKFSNEPLRVLDVCVGTGISAIAVAQSSTLVEIVGVDLSPDMIAVANRKIARRRLGNISIRQMDATQMDFQDGDFDVAMVSFGLHELGHDLMLSVLGEMYRVLKPGGRLYIVDLERPRDPLKRGVFAVYLKLFEPRHMPRFLDLDWRSLLEGFGLQDFESQSFLFSKLMSAFKRPTGSWSAQQAVPADAAAPRS